MIFKDFIELYMGDMEQRLKPSTVANKQFSINSKVTPYFGKIPLREIKLTDVRKWQNRLTNYRDENGQPCSQTYLKTINNQLTAIFNYAVKYYGLRENPCHKAGSMGKKLMKCCSGRRMNSTFSLRASGTERQATPFL